jgi:hypothetical protein
MGLDFGSSHNLYVADNSGQDIYVMAALSPEWELIDLITDVAQLVLAVGALRVAAAVDLPATLSTFSDLFKFLQVAGRLVGEAGRTGSAAQKVVSVFKQVAIKIPSGDYKDVDREGFTNIYFNPDGWASVTGVDTISVLVMSGDGTQVALWTSGADDSWIATRSHTIVRSKYGTIWQADPTSDSVSWPLQALYQSGDAWKQSSAIPELRPSCLVPGAWAFFLLSFDSLLHCS